MTPGLGIFREHATAYADAGLPAFPVNTRAKRPAVKGWRQATTVRTRAWSTIEKLGAADGLGIVMGKPSRITEIDIDGVGEAWLALAVARFGETPITIRTASGKAKLWFRHDGERRHIRPFSGQPIDILGDGFTIAPPSWREDLGAAYAFLTGGICDVDRLPMIRRGALDAAFSQLPEAVTLGGRNTSLWRQCMVQARFCDDVEALLDVAATWASAFPEPLPTAEIERCARSAWSYQIAGRNFVGLAKPQLTEGDRIMDALIDRPEAFTLYQMLVRWHSGRQSFAIAPRAMSEAGSPPWSRHRIESARDVLLERGFLEELAEPSRIRRKAGLYRLAGRLPNSGNNQDTPSPPFAGGVGELIQ
ncbi:bifunctional DNA primase/polymerase [Defluviimonas sp. WL0050]|uniref:Bifunctional DNA primase/polymerase n=1 Tax=Albidovulum litorale TaxID=2984134 RepID=A0ABT2ZKD0_9RHOB|nr:bifunctional DNA primase/polymerase [Defluviimonas sp. WL0050]MCV2871589.1 bifunctional DNA primase/polymerase [Defluviimonas sp. WL0050]